MKKILALLLIISALFALVGCSSFKVYQMNDLLPPLVDITTQYPYTEKITVTDTATGEIREFTDGTEHNMIRMHFEGIQAVREKAKEEPTPLFIITFYTTDGSITISVLSEYAFLLDGYKYEILRSGIDTVYFKNLFSK